MPWHVPTTPMAGDCRDTPWRVPTACPHGVSPRRVHTAILLTVNTRSINVPAMVDSWPVQVHVKIPFTLSTFYKKNTRGNKKNTRDDMSRTEKS